MDLPRTCFGLLSDRFCQIFTGYISTIAGDGTQAIIAGAGPATGSGISQPLGLAFDAAGNMYVGDLNLGTPSNSRIRKVAVGGQVYQDGSPV